jgi:ABC-type branched-subunit amino acid transport system ATPase component
LFSVVLAMADDNKRPIHISFRSVFAQSFEEACSKPFNIRDKMTGDQKSVAVGEKLRFQGDRKPWELLTRLIKSQENQSDGRDTLLLDATKNDEYDYTLDIWPFPNKLTPKNKDESSSEQPETSNRRSVRESTLQYWYLPNHINTVFLIGENGSGKSLFLQRYREECADLCLICTAPNISKDLTAGPLNKNIQKRVRPPKTDRELIDDLTEEGQATVSECFKRITEKWKIEFRKIKNQTEVYFTRLSNDQPHIPTEFRYEQGSDGLRQILRAVLHFPFLSKCKIICLDEPESHLHPRLYYSLVRELMNHLPSADGPFESPKLVIATHDFHLIDSLICMQQPRIRGVVMEMQLDTLTEYSSDSTDTGIAYSEGIKDQLDLPLRSIIFTRCNSDFIFDAEKSQDTFVEYSSALLETMIYTSKMVLFCEGTYGSIDCKIYPLLFDSKQVDIRPVGSSVDVEKKTLAAKNSADLLRSRRLYYGICDRDRNLVKNVEDICVLPVAELENIFWVPEMWSLYPKMLEQLKSYDEISYRNSTHGFWRAFRALVCLNLYHYMCEYAVTDQKQRSKIDEPQLKKISRIEKKNANTDQNMKKTMSLEEKQNQMEKFFSSFHTSATEYKSEWKEALQYAYTVSEKWEESYSSNQDLKNRYLPCIFHLGLLS